MRRIQLVVAVAAMMVAMLSFSVPAMADVDLDDDLYEGGILVHDIDDIDIDDIDIDDLDGEGPVHLID